MSSMRSAPAYIPTTVGSFGAGLADPNLIVGAPIWDLFTEQSSQPGRFGQHHHRHQPVRRSFRRDWAGLFRPHDFGGAAH
jgi:hypothetical protein